MLERGSTTNNAEVPASPSTPSVTVAPSQQAALTPEQSQQMAGWIKADQASGKMTPEQASKAFEELGVPLDQRGPDTRTDEQKELDRHFPQAKPEEYRISYAGPGEDPLPMTPELKQFDTAARTWLSEAGTPREVGNSVVNAIAKTAQLTKGMNDAQLDRYADAEFIKLQRAYGPSLEAKLREAARMVEALDAKQPGLKNLLRAKGIGDNAMVASLLIQQAERYWARRQ